VLIVKEAVSLNEPIGGVAKDAARAIFVKVAIPDDAIVRSVAMIE
jgi:hypothetical protein